MWSGSAEEVGQNTTATIIIMMITSSGWERWRERERERDGGDDDDEEEEDEAKMGVHFPNKWAWLWYSITWRKETKEGPNYIDYSLLSSSCPFLSFRYPTHFLLASYNDPNWMPNVIGTWNSYAFYCRLGLRWCL